MTFYPIFVQLEGRPVLVVGGGLVAERKVEGLIAAGAAVVLVSPEVTTQLQRFWEEGKIELLLRTFEEADLQGKMLVISATDDSAVQQRVAAAAHSEGVLINTADQPALCDFIIPSIVRRGDVAIAISTSGKSPVLAAALRARLEELIPEDIGRAARLLGQIRPEIHSRFEPAEARKHAFETILRNGFLDWLPDCDDNSALERMRKIISELK
jgi:siroheme synthase-like protein